MSLLGAAVALMLGSVVFDAHALSLGRLQVQSALGEPLRAELEVTEITASEADGLRVNIASPEAFRTANIPYSAALSDVRSTLQRRADGRYVVRLSSSRSVSDPFIDLLVEASWSSGRILRDYTVLLDPPANRPASTATVASAPVPTPPQINLRSAPVAVPVAPTPTATPRPRPVVAVGTTLVPVTREAPPARSEGNAQVTVRTGDTASKIASAHKPADVSLDQMLVAMLQANPGAFIGGNVNRVRAGAVLDLPNAAQAGATPAPEARRTVTAQSRDFGDYRRRLAENAPTARDGGNGRQVSGTLQTQVQERNAAAASPDKLTIAQARAADDKLAQARQAQESAARLAELSKNINELNKLQGAGAVAPATTPSAAAPQTPTTAAATAPPPVASPPAPTASSALPGLVAPAAALTASAATPAAQKPAAAPATTPPPAEASVLDELLGNPLLLGGGALLLLLLALLAYRMTRGRREDASESVFLESRLPKDSFFAASGGESVDTKNRSSIISSLSYSPSQLDAGDVDPVAEADVYLAYGRDLQAEEILREALRINPERAAIHLKLLEIHAKRRDLRAYEALATDVHKLTGGTGSDWNRVVDMGKELDPGNPLYEAGLRQAADDTVFPAATVGAAAAMSVPFVVPPPAAPVPPPPAFVSSVAPLDFDLDLSLPETGHTTMPGPITVPAPVSANLPLPPSPAPERFVQTLHEAPRALPVIDDAAADFDTDFNTAPGALETPGFSAPLPLDQATQPAPLRAGTGLVDDSGFIEFDMSALSGLNGRDVGDTEPGRLEPLDDSAENPHAIKLSLARELQTLGDTEGARSLVEEVEAESSGDLKAQARHLLAQWA